MAGRRGVVTARARRNELACGLRAVEQADDGGVEPYVAAGSPVLEQPRQVVNAAAECRAGSPRRRFDARKNRGVDCHGGARRGLSRVTAGETGGVIPTR